MPKATESSDPSPSTTARRKIKTSTLATPATGSHCRRRNQGSSRSVRSPRSRRRAPRGPRCPTWIPLAMASRRLYPYASAIGELLTAWHQDPEYLDDLGSPSPIRMRTGQRSFRHLAAKTVPNINSQILLLELKRIGAITTDADGYIRVHMRALPVYEDKHLAIQHTLASLDSFIRTLRHNLNSAASNSDQLFHRVACNGDVDVREIPALKIRVKKYGQNFLESCDNWMTRKTKSSRHNSGSRRKRAQSLYWGVSRC